MNVRRSVTTAALALGVLAGSAGIAGAMSSPGSTTPSVSAEAADTQTQDPILDSSVQAPEVEGQSEVDESTALESLASITPDDAGQAALEANPGATIDGVQLENENGSIVYEVDLTDSSGAAIEAKVDAGNGAVLAQEAGDDDSNEGAEGPEDDVHEGAEGPEDDVHEGAEDDEDPEVAPGN